MSPRPVVDVHTHFVPSEIVDFFASSDGPDGITIQERDGRHPLIVHTNGLAYPVFPAFNDPAAKLSEMDRLGIDFSLVSIVPTLFLYELEPEQTIRSHRTINDAAARYVERGGGRLGAMATVPLNDPEAAAAELRRACGVLGLRGVEIGTSAGSLTIDAPELDPFFSTAEELGVPVMLHPYEMMLTEPEPGLRGFHLANVVGNPLETFIGASRMAVGGVLDKHPSLRVLLVHGGGSFPYQLGRLSHAYRARHETGAVARRNPAEYLENFLFDTVIFDQRSLKFLLSMAGPARVLFGSDMPFDMADTSALETVPNVAADASEMILGGNAVEYFRLTP